MPVTTGSGRTRGVPRDVWKRGSFHGVPWIAQFWMRGWWSDTTPGYGCSGMHRLTVSRQLATDVVVCTVSKCHDSWYWNALDSRSSEASVLVSGRLRRMVSEVFVKHFGVVYSWSTMSSSFVSCLAWCCIVESQRILSLLMHLHDSSSPCHICLFAPRFIHMSSMSA